VIVARAPLRISFAGGGTDLPAYYERFGGMVLSAAITPACHVRLSPWRGDGVLLVSADYGRTLTVRRHTSVTIAEPLSLPRAVLAWFAARDLLPSGVRLELKADVAPGSGLGSSSAMTVAMVTALAHHVSMPLAPRQAAEIACEIEIDLLARPIGRQDQYAAAIGGLNTLVFTPDGVEIDPLCLPPDAARCFESHLVLVSTRRTRDSASVLKAQRAATGVDTEVTKRLHDLKALAAAMREALTAGDIARFGALLDEGWRLKRGLNAGISSAEIDHWYELARDAGAYGGKIAGAGGGGFFLFCVPPARRTALVKRMRAAGLTPFPFALDVNGATACDVVVPATPRANGARVAMKGVPA
jgi:D-glycero-alpha-D-manno-heptose-7-phosphate kinase